MNDRIQVPSALQEEVLVASRRRCAICFGLRRDTGIKIGQIAHLDHDAANNSPDNLVFLCLEDHAIYDSRSRQAKGYTPAEVRRYRSELYSSIDSEWAKPAVFTPIPETNPLAPLAGHYVRETPGAPAEFLLTPLNDRIVQVSGLALWEGASSAHTGSLDFATEVRGDKIIFADRLGSDWYNLELRVASEHIVASESAHTGYHGMNVTFDGTYRRVP